MADRASPGLSLTAGHAVELIRLASSPIAKALIALAYYMGGDDSAVAEAVWR